MNAQVGRGRPTGGMPDEPGRKGLFVGILVYRWATFAWMASLAVVVRDDLRRPGLAWTALGVTLVWNVWFTIARGWRWPAARWVDLGLATALLPISGLVMEPGAAGGSAPFFATSYPVSAALTVGAADGLAAGLGASAILSIALAWARPANGLPLSQMSAAQWAALVNGIVYYVAAGGAAGVVSRVLTRSAQERGLAVEEAARERERAARLAEREELGREIHDSVLQALALVGKRGRELSERDSVPGGEVRGLLELAGRQEQALRALLSEPHEAPPPGTTSLRTELRAAAFSVDGVPVTVSAAGPLWVPTAQAEAVGGAVRQALANVARHAKATRATVFAERLDGEVVISIRDDGIGFEYDEATLAAEGKLGMLRSMKDRVEERGGRMVVHSARMRGTEVEFHLPDGEGLG